MVFKLTVNDVKRKEYIQEHNIALSTLNGMARKAISIEYNAFVAGLWHGHKGHPVQPTVVTKPRRRTWKSTNHCRP